MQFGWCIVFLVAAWWGWPADCVVGAKFRGDGFVELCLELVNNLSGELSPGDKDWQVNVAGRISVDL